MSAPPFYLARQPIVDARLQLVAYELLFRGTGGHEHAVVGDGSTATAQLLNEGLGVNGLSELVGDEVMVFLNFGHALLTTQAAFALEPPRRFVVEILEDVPAADDVRAAARGLRDRGFGVALDDVISAERIHAFRGDIDWVKIDVRGTAPSALPGVVLASRSAGAHVLAEKVETQSEFEALRQLGVEHFQGYLFGRPELRQGTALPSLSGPQLRFVQAALAPEFDLQGAVRAVSGDPALTTRVLGMANAAAEMPAATVRSVRAAVVRLGTERLRHVAALLAFAPAATASHLRVPLTDALIRACFCEVLAGRLPGGATGFACFVGGMLTGLTDHLGLRIEQTIARAPMDPEVRADLLSGEGPCSAVIATVKHYLAGDWAHAAVDAQRLGLDPSWLPVLYRRAVAMATDLIDR